MCPSDAGHKLLDSMLPDWESLLFASHAKTKVA